MFGLMDQLEIERAHVVGNSMGGRVAIEMGLPPARADPRARAALSRRGVDQARASSDRPGAAARVRSAPARAPPLDRRVAVLEHVLRPRPRSIPPSPTWWSTSSSASTTPPAPAMRCWPARATSTSRRRSAATASTAGWPICEPPALFVWGSHDRLVPPAFSRHVRKMAAERRAGDDRSVRPRTAGRARRRRRTRCSPTSSAGSSSPSRGAHRRAADAARRGRLITTFKP